MAKDFLHDFILSSENFHCLNYCRIAQIFQVFCRMLANLAINFDGLVFQTSHCISSNLLCSWTSVIYRMFHAKLFRSLYKLNVSVASNAAFVSWLWNQTHSWKMKVWKEKEQYGRYEKRCILQCKLANCFPDWSLNFTRFVKKIKPHAPMQHVKSCYN